MSNNHTNINHLVEEEEKKKQKIESVVPTKEGEPFLTTSEKKMEPRVEVVESEPMIEDKEVEKFMKVEKDNFELDPKLKKAGLEVIDSTTLDPRHNVKLPISDEKVLEGLQQPVNSSWRWLAEIAQFMLIRAHISLKKIHGHIVRVIKK